MPYRINFADYAKGIPVTGPVDAGASLRALAEQNIRQAEFNQNSEMRQKERIDNINQQRQVSHDINARFAAAQAQDIKYKQVGESKSKYAEHLKTLDTARQLVTSGRWSEAMALVGKLKDQGADIKVSNGPDGKPVFDLPAAKYSGPELSGDFNSIYGQISGQPHTIDSYQPAAVNPAETVLGTSAASAAGGQTPVTDLPPPAATTDGSDTGYQAPATPLPEAQSVSKSGAPVNTPQSATTLDTSQLTQWNQMQLNPVLQGIENAVPYQYRSQARSFLQGFPALGQTPAQTLDTLQKPFDTTAGLWKGEMAADAARARASMSQGSQESNRDLRVQGMGWQQAKNISDGLELPVHTRQYNEVDQVDRMLGENNPMADSQILHQVRKMFQTGVATQKDIDAVKEGVGKGFMQQLADVANEQIMGTGLNPDSRAGLRRFLQSLKTSHLSQILNAGSQLESMVESANSIEEAKSNVKLMNTMIPKSLWSDKQKKWNEMFFSSVESKPSIRGPGGHKQSASASASGSNPSAAVTDDPEAEADRLLSE